MTAFKAISKRKRASILALTLWVLCFLSLFGLYLSQSVRQKLTLVKRISFQSGLYQIADAGVQKAISLILQNDKDYHALKDEWSDNPTIFQDIRVGLGSFTVSYEQTVKGQEIIERFGCLDEERKININTASRQTIQKLIEVVSAIDTDRAQEIAAAIVDWRDKDSVPSIAFGSAENSYYNSLDDPYACKDAPFQILDELLLVKGVDRKLFSRIKNFVTIYGSGKVNVNTAPEEVLLALAIEERVVEKIIEFRRGKDGIEASSDDNVFNSPQSIVAQLSQFSSLSDSQAANLSSVAAGGVFDVVSSVFSARSLSKIGNLKKEVTCIFENSGKILYWRE